MEPNKFVRTKPVDVPEKQITPVASPEPEPIEHESLFARSFHLVTVFSSLLLFGLFSYFMSDWSAYGVAKLHPGQLVFSDTMTQLWTALFRLTFIVAVCLMLIRLIMPVLFSFWRADKRGLLDLEQSFSQLTPQWKVSIFFAVLFGFCYLVVALLQVNLPQAVSVTP